ncbi:hypothetical protein L484_002737 [Morus notabilis]|uniref:Uncharacterized protein n=1 Tax=Morus notabilis TaxID=981085 RepID=W9QT15_9ROSA|nr:hypothetical protein L484_002737 [Morus notabilis]
MALRVMRIMITTKTSRFILALLHILIVAVVVDSAGRSLPRAIIFDDDLVSDGIDGHDHVRRQQDQLNSSLLLLPSREFELYYYSSEEHKCEQMYGFLPCSDNIFGHLFLIVVYEYLLFHGESYLAEGSERIFKILGPGFFGASAFHVLGALPESLLLLGNYVFSFLASPYNFTNS